MKESLGYVENFLKSFYQRILSNTYLSTDELAISRILVGVYFLVIDRPSYIWINEVPSSFFNPPILSLANLFSGFPPEIYFIITDYFLILLLLLVVIGLYSRFCFLLLFFIIIINNSFAYSFGKIDHSILGTILFLFFGFSNSGTKFSIKKDKILDYQNLAIVLYTFCIVFGYFTAGFEKFQNWVDFDFNTNGLLSWFYPNYFNIINTDSIAKYLFLIPNELLEIFDYTVVLFELSGILFLLISFRSWFLYLFLASIFHLSNSILLNIPFTAHAMIFSLWLLNPLVLKHKWLLIFMIFGMYPDPVFSGILIWISLIVLSCFNFIPFKNSRDNGISNGSYYSGKPFNLSIIS